MGALSHFGKSMETKFTNVTGIPTSVAAWLVYDDYDYVPGEKEISVTTLLKPVRQLILANRIKKEATANVVDLSALVKSSIGNAIHGSIEHVWKTPELLKASLKALGWKPFLINKIKVNPTPDEVAMGCIPVYMEIRGKRQIGEYTICGKFDAVLDGVIEDFKSTGTYTYTKQTNAIKYIQQGSIYKWIFPEIITKPTLNINYLFTDWSANRAKGSKDYPPSPVYVQSLTLMDTQETERFIANKLMLLEEYADAPQEEIPECTSEELWRSDPVWKYYTKEGNAKATKVFNNHAEATMFFVEKGSKGIIREFKGKAKACNFCSAAVICEQRAQLVLMDELQ